MSAPAFAWAFEKGHELGLTSSQLLLLLYMADQANCIGSFYTGQSRMVKFTRLSTRTIRELVPQLASFGLITVVATPGKPTQYHIMRQPKGEATTAAQATTAGRANGATPAATAVVTPAATAVVSLPHPGNLRTPPRQNLHATPAATAGDPLGTQEENPKSRAHTREEGRQGLNSGKGDAATPAAEPPLTPQAGTTDGSGPPDDPFRDDGGASKAYATRLLGRTVHLATSQPDVVTEDDRPQTEADRERMAAQIAKLVESIAGSGPRGFKPRKGALTMRAYPLGERNVFDADQQQDIYRALTRPKPKHLAGEQLAAARRIAMARIPQ